MAVRAPVEAVVVVVGADGRVVVGAGGRVVVGAGGRVVVGVVGLVAAVAPPSSRVLRGVSEVVVVLGVAVLVVVGAGGIVVAADGEVPALVVRPANASEAGAVWNWRTPARPSAVPTMTKGARFIALLQSSERKLLNMNSIGVHAQSGKSGGNLIGESRGTAEVHITLGDIWNQAPQDSCVEGHILARTDDFV